MSGGEWPGEWGPSSDGQSKRERRVLEEPERPGLKVKCPECGMLNKIDSEHCEICGSKLAMGVWVETGRPQNLQDQQPATRKHLGVTVLRLLVGPALTIAAGAVAVGLVWLRTLAENPQNPATIVDDTRTASNLSAGGLVAFVILATVAIAILAYQRT